MRRWMHTCYTLVTSEESQTLILKSLSSLQLLHSLALQRCFSAEQMRKRPLKEVEGMYLYTPQTNPTVTCQISKTRTDWTRWSTWPDAPCNRTDQIIRAQVQKHASKRSNFRTWAHIIPVVNRNHEGFQTNLLTTKIASFNIQRHTLHYTSSSKISLHTRSCKYYKPSL
jgi:hypothetical protein